MTISIYLPNHQHEKYAVMALEAGKHLYCEKPLATSYRRLRIRKAADKSGKVAQMVFNNRHSGSDARSSSWWTRPAGPAAVLPGGV